jgi:hypothetical protein
MHPTHLKHYFMFKIQDFFVTTFKRCLAKYGVKFKILNLIYILSHSTQH